MLKAEVDIMTIHKNLRQLRLSCSMTQEQVAEKIAVTRQALSSYESGRTRPDIDMLMRLAEVYGTDLEIILYGQDMQLKAIRRIKITSAVLGGLLILLTFISSAVFWYANKFCYLTEGILSPEEMVVLESRMRLLDVRAITDQVLLTVSWLGALLLLVFLVTGKAIIPIKAKLLFTVLLSAAILAIPVVFGMLDPAFSVAEHIFTPVFVAARLLLFLIIDLVIEYIKGRKHRA